MLLSWPRLGIYVRSRQKCPQLWKLFDNNNRCTDYNNMFVMYFVRSGRDQEC